ncbi:MAG: hypothetical protein ACK2U3_12630 [Anaerolineales bacterium]|jgi:hypothetical protein
MPKDIDPQTMNADNLPGIWSPVQWELSEEEQLQELEEQSTASLLFSVDPPEAILRLLLNEYTIERAYEQPKGYNSEQQGDWDSDLLTFKFKRAFTLNHIERNLDSLYLEYKVEDLGTWVVEIGSDNVNIYRL